MKQIYLSLLLKKKNILPHPLVFLNFKNKKQPSVNKYIKKNVELQPTVKRREEEQVIKDLNYWSKTWIFIPEGKILPGATN